MIPTGGETLSRRSLGIYKRLSFRLIAVNEAYVTNCQYSQWDGKQGVFGIGEDNLLPTNPIDVLIRVNRHRPYSQKPSQIGLYEMVDYPRNRQKNVEQIV